MSPVVDSAKILLVDQAPIRAIVTSNTDAGQRRNYSRDPRTLNGQTAVSNSVVAVALTNVSDWRGGAVRATRTATGAARFGLLAQAIPVSMVYSLRFSLRCSSPISAMQVLFRPAGGGTTTAQVTYAAALAVPAGISDFVLDGFMHPSNSTTNASYALVWSDGDIGQTVDVTDILVEQAPVSGKVFSGDDVSIYPYTYSWVGTQRNSHSLEDTVSSVQSLYIA